MAQLPIQNTRSPRDGYMPLDDDDKITMDPIMTRLRIRVRNRCIAIAFLFIIVFIGYFQQNQIMRKHRYPHIFFCIFHIACSLFLALIISASSNMKKIKYFFYVYGLGTVVFAGYYFYYFLSLLLKGLGCTSDTSDKSWWKCKHALDLSQEWPFVLLCSAYLFIFLCGAILFFNTRCANVHFIFLQGFFARKRRGL
eukprot:TRINITY_DN1908_c0_g1_i2.p1 TRINITY_DN1908_c0_g1~~TRINITY_DN1908_c0_g1_i2.p1  ORF type:complete len:196 (+),score=23.35 TRINITY_DN1908_c0_g1_i2:470-1057(+)